MAEGAEMRRGTYDGVCGIAAGRQDALDGSRVGNRLRDEYPDLSIREELAKVERLRHQLRRFAASHDDSLADDLGRIAIAQQVLLRPMRLSRAQARLLQSKEQLPQRSDDRRNGIPITLSVIYADLGDVIGLDLHGVNLPGHFVLGPVATRGAPAVFIDVFNGGPCSIGTAACSASPQTCGAGRL